MGYTRYWIRPRELDAASFAKFAAACETACESFQPGLVNFQFTEDVVAFEGHPGCEPFIVARLSAGRVRPDGVLEYCKTQKLPYDSAVEACLSLLRKHFSEVVVPAPS